MPLAERRERHATLLAQIRTHDVHRWRREFLGALTAVEPRARAGAG
jgi:trehalose 6-phosphate synthase